MRSHIGRLAASCVLLVLVHWTSASIAHAGTCGVLPFTHGADVTEGAATNITSLVSTELDFRGGWTIVVTASKQEITDGCGADSACLMAFGKGESHDSVVTGEIATQGSDMYRITTRWYEVSTGRMKREATQDISRSADKLVDEVPALVTELLTGKKPVAPEEAEEEEATSFASLDEIDFDDLEEEDEDDVRPRERPKRDNRGRLREPTEDNEDPFGFDADDLEDLDEVDERNRRDRIAAVERAEREDEERRARQEEERRARRLAEERREREEEEAREREERRERERRARERAEREREEEERRAAAEERRRDDERRAEERRREEERERRAEERRREREEDERRAAAEREEEEERRRRADRAEERRRERERQARADAEEEAERERREQQAESRRRARLAEREEDPEEVDYADVELGSALAEGAISFDSVDDEEGYVGISMEDADEDDEPLISMEDADEDDEPLISMEDADEDDELRPGDLVGVDDEYVDPGARRRAAAASRRSARDDRYSRARSFGSRDYDEDEDEDEDDGYASVDEDEDEDRRSSRSDRRSRSRDRDEDRDGTYRYRPRDRDDDEMDLDDENFGRGSDSLGNRSTGRAARRATTAPTKRRHVSIRGGGGVSNYYLWFGQYGLDVGIFPIDPISIDIGIEGWSLSLTEQAQDEDGQPLWDENGEAVTTTELRTLPHFSVGASWRGNFHRVIKPYAGGDIGGIMYATERLPDGETTPRFGVTGMAKGGADFMFTRVVGAHVGVRLGVAYSPMVEELVYFEWNPVTFVFNIKAGLTLAF